jgi:hypothetical protein
MYVTVFYKDSSYISPLISEDSVLFAQVTTIHFWNQKKNSCDKFVKYPGKLSDFIFWKKSTLQYNFNSL